MIRLPLLRNATLNNGFINSDLSFFESVYIHKFGMSFTGEKNKLLKLFKKNGISRTFHVTSTTKFHVTGVLFHRKWKKCKITKRYNNKLWLMGGGTFTNIFE